MLNSSTTFLVPLPYPRCMFLIPWQAINLALAAVDTCMVAVGIGDVETGTARREGRGSNSQTKGALGRGEEGDPEDEKEQ